MSGIALFLACLLFLLGLAGTVLPVLPGAILVYAGMILYGVMTEFSSLTVNFFLLQGLVLVFIFAIDFLSAAAGTKRYGGTKAGGWGAALGTLAGLIFMGPFGLIIGPFLGAVLAELLLGKKSADQAVRAGFGTLIGILGGTILKLVMEVVMIVYFFLSI